MIIPAKGACWFTLCLIESIIILDYSYRRCRLLFPRSTDSGQLLFYILITLCSILHWVPSYTRQYSIDKHLYFHVNCGSLLFSHNNSLWRCYKSTKQSGIIANCCSNWSVILVDDDNYWYLYFRGTVTIQWNWAGKS